jgi:hypothetical protein
MDPKVFTARAEVFNTHGPGFFNGIWRLLSASQRQLERPKEGFLSIRSPRERDLRRKPSTIRMICWCCKRGLNSRPLPYQGSALPLSYCSIRSASEQRGASCHSTEGMARRAEPFLRRCAFPAGPSGKGAAEGSTGCPDERNRGALGQGATSGLRNSEHMLSFFLWTDWTIFSASAGDEIDRPSRRAGSEPARGFFCLERL